MKLNYSTTKREYLAILRRIRKFHPYGRGYHFKAITNHSSLKWLCNIHNPSERLVRWSLEIQAYEFEVEHRKGSQELVPHALSHMFDDENPAVSVASIEMSDGTTNTWYCCVYNQMRDAATEHPWGKIVSSRLYNRGAGSRKGL